MMKKEAPRSGALPFLFEGGGNPVQGVPVELVGEVSVDSTGGGGGGVAQRLADVEASSPARSTR